MTPCGARSSRVMRTYHDDASPDRLPRTLRIGTHHALSPIATIEAAMHHEDLIDDTGALDGSPDPDEWTAPRGWRVTDMRQQYTLEPRQTMPHLRAPDGSILAWTDDADLTVLGSQVILSRPHCPPRIIWQSADAGGAGLVIAALWSAIKDAEASEAVDVRAIAEAAL